MGLCVSKKHQYDEKRPRYTKIPDKFENLEEVSAALREAGVEACQLVVGIDFTKSNTWNGEKTFNGECLHSVHGPPNPYLRTLSLIARTLEFFDDDNLIPCYGFGDAETREKSVFSFFPNNQPAKGLESLLMRYRQIAPLVHLSGPTSFAPLIFQAMQNVYDSGMQFHVLLIVADGQISETCMPATQKAIVAAAEFPLSIVMVGVGDGPWQSMRYFDDALPKRSWDNFQFVEFDKIIRNPALVTDERQEASFALNALMELPDQYRFAEKMIGESAKASVQHLIKSISSTILVEPAAHYSSPAIPEQQTNATTANALPEEFVNDPAFNGQLSFASDLKPPLTEQIKQFSNASAPPLYTQR